MVLPKRVVFITTGVLIAFILIYFIFFNQKNRAENNNESFADEQKMFRKFFLCFGDINLLQEKSIKLL